MIFGANGRHDGVFGTNGRLAKPHKMSRQASLIGWLVDWLAGWLAASLVGRLVGRLAGWLACWLAGRLVVMGGVLVGG